MRSKIDVHKSVSFSEHVAAYESCDFGRCFASMSGIMELAFILQEAMDIVRQTLGKIEMSLFVEAEERINKLVALSTMSGRDCFVNLSQGNRGNE